MNLFQKALAKNELNKFINGEGEYLVVDREYGGHWQLGSYLNYIENNLKDGIFPIEFWQQLFSNLEKNNDINLFLDNVVAYFIPYYSCPDLILKEYRVSNTPIEIVKKIKKILNVNKQMLIVDTRGTGVVWNSKSGLWGGITSNLLIIRKRGGPNFLNDEFI